MNVIVVKAEFWKELELSKFVTLQDWNFAGSVLAEKVKDRKILKFFMANVQIVRIVIKQKHQFRKTRRLVTLIT